MSGLQRAGLKPRLPPGVLVSGVAALALAGCTLAPHYQRPAPPIPATFPTGDAYAPASGKAAAQIDYADVVVDARLRTLVTQALANNRDLRIAAANIVAARAQYQIQRADLFPHIDLTGAGTTSGGGDGPNETSARSYSLKLGVPSYELDFFGRLRSLSTAARDRYLATEAGAKATRLTLIGDLADAWSTYAADMTLLAIAQDTAANAQNSVRLTQARLEGQVAARTDLAQAQGVLSDAQASIALQRTAIAQDVNALQLLVGAPVDAGLLPKSVDEIGPAFALIPAGVDSSVLLARPDVMAAEYDLRAANADIGAARAALFPSISITGLAGVASNALSSLFESGAYAYSAGANLGLPIFQAGAGVAGVRLSQAQRDAAVASYERSIQAAFRDTADALARQGTIEDQLTAQRASVAAAQDTARLSEARYRAGVDSFLTSLVAQRQLFTARRALANVQLTSAVNRVDLYRALGGGAGGGEAGER
jgi:multidrug efflux system outer membrane protein